MVMLGKAPFPGKKEWTMAAPHAAPPWFVTTLSSLLERRDLDPVRMCELMHCVLTGNCREVELAALLLALRMKGETSAELAAAAAVLREYMIPLATERVGLLDTCGTGGDGLGTFNISTATALVVAGAGVPVVKHGNRAVSSHSGSADVLAVLGVALDLSPDATRKCLERAGMAFCLAPNYHPALRQVGEVRRRLGVRTMFNCLGPLVNPAGASFQLLGVGWKEWLDRLAGAVVRLDARRAFLVCGKDGLDEVSLSAPTLVREVRDGEVLAYEWTAADFALAPCTLDELRAGGPEESARMIREVLEGRPGAPLRVVLANAAAALLAAGEAASLPEGVAQAREAVTSGRAAKVLQELIACSQRKED
jgi:anthranilate phosphoribosyltransferase